MTNTLIGVIGGSECSREIETLAEAVGEGLAQRGAVLICGGRGGVMAAACRGAARRGGTTIGLLPGTDRGEANPWVSLAIPTGLGQARNAVIATAAAALIAVDGSYGTLSEIALALRLGRPVIGLRSWDIDGVTPADSPDAAVSLALARVS
jgi:uncharacterized protein (TIGR00725 family)